MSRNLSHFRRLSSPILSSSCATLANPVSGQCPISSASCRYFSSPSVSTSPPVFSTNGYSTLREVIVGRIQQSRIPPDERHLRASVPEPLQRIMKQSGGEPLPKGLVERAEQELSEFIQALENEGVRVVRPAESSEEQASTSIRGLNWTSKPLGDSACVRDAFLVIGNQIIEAPIAWRSRQRDGAFLYPVFLDYFRRGARWIQAPKPQLLDSLYQPMTETTPLATIHYATNESEAVFDAADFARCDRTLFVQRSHATNRLGIEWLARTLGSQYRVIPIDQRCISPLHIDCTLVPIGPKTLLVNPAYLRAADLDPFILKEYRVFEGPIIPPLQPSERTEYHEYNMCSHNLGYNLLMINPRLAIVDRSQRRLIDFLSHHGIRSIELSSRYLSPFGGSFHCLTLDTLRYNHNLEHEMQQFDQSTVHRMSSDNSLNTQLIFQS
jgi:glycine amidinotransferase